MGVEMITIGDILELITFISAIIASGGVVVKFANKNARKAIKTVLAEELEPLKESDRKTAVQLRLIQETAADNATKIARIDLDRAIHFYPQETSAILKLGEHYFLELGGNSYMHNEFKRWGEENGVDTAYILDKVKKD